MPKLKALFMGQIQAIAGATYLIKPEGYHYMFMPKSCPTFQHPLLLSAMWIQDSK